MTLSVNLKSIVT